MNFLSSMARVLLLAGIVALLSKDKLNPQGNMTDWNQRRRCKSNAERRIFDALARYNFHMLTQVPMGKDDTIDIFLTEYGIVIECDSIFHDSYKAQLRDRQKEAAIHAMGWNVFRVCDTEIHSDSKGVVKRILHMINQKKQQDKTEQETKFESATVYKFTYTPKRWNKTRGRSQ